jgi:enoyl-CoA hydratase
MVTHTMTNRTILTETHGRVGLIRLNRPAQLNALNDELMDALGAALLAFDGNADVGAILVTGSDKAFAAGADIAVMADWTYMDVYQGGFITRNWETIRQVRKPVIAAVAGFALGGGCELALACDIIVAAESAKFALPEIKLAMLPGAGGTQRLPRAVGKAKAMDMCLSARVLSAQEADRYGLVSRVVPDLELQTTALKLATRRRPRRHARLSEQTPARVPTPLSGKLAHSENRVVRFRRPSPLTPSVASVPTCSLHPKRWGSALQLHQRAAKSVYCEFPHFLFRKHA